MLSNDIAWDYDLKRILLGKEYKEHRPIKNALKGKQYREDYSGNYARYTPGHVENYQIVDDVFAALMPHSNTTNKDIMHSFWTTYKYYLQLEYSEVFMPDGSIKQGRPPLMLPTQPKAPALNYPPFSDRSYKCVGEQYSLYYKTYFPELTVDARDTWIDFLLNNFDCFMKVNGSKELNTFARLTHTIGNICIVPKGFNSGRGASDYWDWAMVFLREYLITFGGWEQCVRTHFLEDYVEDCDYSVKPLWANHLDTDITIPYYPQNIEQIHAFLANANHKIQSRGKRIIKQFNEAMASKNSV